MDPRGLFIAQDSKYEGNDWWCWAVWVEGPEDQLDQIESVQYTLHHTFPKPVRVIRDRSTKFRLETAGWGTFTIYAKVIRKDGGVIPLAHELELYYPGW
jgi:transcription initiation factor IIF auxiliary subunit